MKLRRIPNPARTKDLVFCIVILFLPALNFFLFNIGNYVNMFRLAFDPTVEIEGAGVFSNFVNFWNSTVFFLSYFVTKPPIKASK